MNLKSAFKKKEIWKWKIIAFDIGSKTVGIAMNDGMISYPVETIVFSENNFLSAFQKIKKIVIFQNELTGIDLVVFGYPFHLKNFKSKFFKTIKFLEEKLHRFFVKENKKIEIFGWDERNSTKLVEEKYKFFKSKIGKKIKIDSLAAKIILDNFLFFWKNSTL